MTRSDKHGEGLPSGWVTEEESDDAYSWLGPEERVVCRRDVNDSGRWAAHAQPRGELAEPARIPIVDEPTDFEEALSAVREYMRRHRAVE